jgi:hypothetical protein
MPFHFRLGGYRLHPTMRERMWKPGESGNPSGMNEAVQLARERVERATERRKNPSPGAVRTRRYRERRKQGNMLLEIDVYQGGIDCLIEFGWLRDVDRSDRRAVTDAFLRFTRRAFELRIKPKSSGP